MQNESKKSKQKYIFEEFYTPWGLVFITYMMCALDKKRCITYMMCPSLQRKAEWIVIHSAISFGKSKMKLKIVDAIPRQPLQLFPKRCKLIELVVGIYQRMTR